jgi:transcriptional regulator with XRE-family HTH domain
MYSKLEYFNQNHHSKFVSQMNLGFKIKKIRELRDFTQEYLAEKIGITQSSYSKIENGNDDILYSKLQEIATVFNLRVEDIIGFNENIVFNLKNNKKANGLVINQVSANEKKVYEEYIATLKDENSYLKTMIDKLLQKK